MNLSQFKSWFEGFTENMDGPPSKKQWARVQERVEEISPDPMPAPVFIDRYVRPYVTWWNGTSQLCSGGTFGQIVQANNALKNVPETAFYCAGQLEQEKLDSAA